VPTGDRHFKCPTCRAVLRPYQQRLVCDLCGGMQLSDAELARSIEGYTHAPPTLAWSYSVTNRVCPQCPLPLHAAQVAIDVVAYKVELLLKLAHCTDHGAWFEGQQLGTLLTIVERRAAR
jgi:hypothetical protein